VPGTWSNWAGSVSCAPHEFAEPSCEDELAALIREAGEHDREVRVVGSGHSFQPVVATTGTLVSLANWRGITACDPDALTASVRAGTVLHDLGEPLLARGVAMENLGDVDVQSLGGALGTGTHGTGHTLGNLPSQVIGLRLMLANGDLLECSAEHEPEAFAAARVSLGALGIISTATLRLVPAFRLHERIWRCGAPEILEGIEERVAAHRHFEFFWYPPRDLVEAKALQPTDAEPSDLADREGERIGWSPHIIPSVRELRFHEMEYSVPAEVGSQCFRVVRDRIRARWPDLQWPVEWRTLRSDDAWLSTAHGRETVTISVHEDARLPFRELFADIEAIFREHAGRPHWGKIHGLRAAELAGLYPKWSEFQRTRRRLDPEGRFMNDHLRELFE
jgi:FAD/FMN-containing dehydrogenase